MQSAFIVNDQNGKPYAVVALLAGGTDFYPIAEAAKSWAGWMKDEYASRKINKQQLSVTLDNSMDVQGPMVVNRTNKMRIDQLLQQAKKPALVEQVENSKPAPEQKSVSLLPVISIVDARLDNLANDEWRNAVNYKAKSFLFESNKSTFAYEVKRTRAVWDPSLAVPGTERRGGWRCPVGTRYGGEITDRFGRNCGWGIARRLANEISDLGERLENIGDRRRGRRLARRNERMVRRLQEGGRVERGARRVAEALESAVKPTRGNDNNQQNAGLVERAARGLAERLESGAPRRPNRRRRGDSVNKPETERPGLLERGARAVREILETDGADREATPAPRRPRPARAPQARPARPARPRQPRRPQNDNAPAPRAPRDNISGTPVPTGRPNPGESLSDYKTRKYNEHQARVRRIREEGGRAGFLRREEWERFHGPAVEEAWNRANPNGGRSARRVATDAGAARTAGRRPKPQDRPDRVQPRGRNRRPFAAPGQRGLANEQAARNRREKMERADRFQEYKIVKHNGKYYVVAKDEVDRANARGANLDVLREPPRIRPAARPAQPNANLPRQYDAPLRENGWVNQNGGKKWVKGNWEVEVLENGNLKAKNRNTGQILEQGKASDMEAGDHLKAFEDILRNQDSAGFRAATNPPSPPSVTTPANPETVVDADLKPTRSPRKKAEIGSLRPAIKALHEEDAKIDDIKDGIIVDAVLDDELVDARGNELDRDALLRDGFLDHVGHNGTFENRRFKFKLIKSNNNYGPWEVVKVEDKKTGEVWFMKSSGYGQNDALLENIGMRAAQALEFGNDENELRIGDERSVLGYNGTRDKKQRWMMMRHIKHWAEDRDQGPGEWQDAQQRPLRPGERIEVRDAARIAVLDYVLDNQDRHGKNFQARAGRGGRVRLGVIDMGLLGGGRERAGEDMVVDEQGWDRYARRAEAEGVRAYGGYFNNGINGLRGFGFRHENQQEREKFAEQARRAAERIRRDLDQIFDIDRIEARGVKLTDAEKAHARALKRVAEARLRKLLQDGELRILVEAFN